MTASQQIDNQIKELGESLTICPAEKRNKEQGGE